MHSKRGNEMVKESLFRDEAFVKHYVTWRESADLTAKLREIRSAYEACFFGYEQEDIQLIKSPTYHMLVIQTPAELREMQYLMDYWKERLVAAGYLLYMSDTRREKMDGGRMELLERHYLKPDIFDAMMQGEKVDRLYGNITLELSHDTHDYEFLKLTQAFYHERDQKLPMGLDKLMEYLLK